MATGIMKKELQQKILEASFADILGQETAKEQLKSALLMQRHVIIVGSPGIGKTTLAKGVASLLGEGGESAERFVRIQGSPDLTSEDLLGDIDPVKALKHGPSSIEAFSKGKIFKADGGVLFFDELNRCPPKLQNALLQVLEEGKATIGSYDVDFDISFAFIGTLNPNDSTTEKLSEVFLDRCDLVYMGYPESLKLEKSIVESKGGKSAEFPEDLLEKTVGFVRALRESPKLEKFPSVRATIGLYERAQANAVLRNRERVEAGDVKDAIVSVLAHRIGLKPSARYTETTREFLQEEIQEQFGAASGEYG